MTSKHNIWQGIAAPPPKEKGELHKQIEELKRQALSALAQQQNSLGGGFSNSVAQALYEQGMTNAISPDRYYEKRDVQDLQQQILNRLNEQDRAKPKYENGILKMEVAINSRTPAKFACTLKHLAIAAELPPSIQLKMVDTVPETGELSIVALVDGVVASHQFTPTEVDGGAAYIETILRWKATAKPPEAATGSGVSRQP